RPRANPANVQMTARSRWNAILNGLLAQLKLQAPARIVPIASAEAVSPADIPAPLPRTLDVAATAEGDTNPACGLVRPNIMRNGNLPPICRGNAEARMPTNVGQSWIC